uniref:Uncharacterized protein n=1 Tax=Steinernema glaseri TaxID=37863 RepID=A0A1I7YQ64_9BILA
MFAIIPHNYAFLEKPDTRAKARASLETSRRLDVLSSALFPASNNSPNRGRPLLEPRPLDNSRRHNFLCRPWCTLIVSELSSLLMICGRNRADRAIGERAGGVRSTFTDRHVPASVADGAQHDRQPQDRRVSGTPNVSGRPRSLRYERLLDEQKIIRNLLKEGPENYDWRVRPRGSVDPRVEDRPVVVDVNMYLR